MGKPFQFRLQRVLDYRGQLEDRAKQALAQAQAAHDAQQQVVNGLLERLEQLQAEESSQKADINQMWLRRQYKQALERDLLDAKSHLGKLALNLQRCRQDAVRKSKNRKLLDKLKEQQAVKHHDEEQLREEKENDEMAALRFRREDL
ncbi:MAG: flagellar export protein FliJ [Desulfovibrionaceae bacterium]